MPEDRPAWDAHQHGPASARTTGGLYFRIRLRDGEVRWIEHVCQPVLDAAGAYLGHRGSNRDVTERMRAREALRASLRDWQRTFDALGDPVLILDAELRIRQINRAAAALLGDRAPSAVGCRCHEAVHGLPRCVAGCPTARMLASRRREESDIGVDGRVYRVVSDPIVGEDDRLEGVVHVMTDVTDRRRAEADLSRSEDRLAQAQRIAGLGSWDWDIAAGTLAWSDEVYRIFGLEPAAFGATYAAFLERVHPEDRAAVAAAVDRSLADPAVPYGIEHRVVRPDGGERVVHEQGEVSRDPGGRPVRMIGTVHDITSRKRAEEDVQALRRDLEHLTRVSTMGEVAGALAHEINQPLAAILANAQAAQRLLAAGAPDLAEIRAILGDIVGDDKRAGEVIRRLRGLVKKGVHPEHGRVDLDEMVRDVAVLVRPEALARGTRLELSPAGDLPPVRAGRVEVQQVLLNLALNALDAMGSAAPERRRLTIETGRDGDHAVVTIRDTGPGIPPDRREEIFLPFHTTKPGGLGMGLAIVRSIAREHGGWIRVEDDPGGGAVFRFGLPAAPPGP